MKAFFDTSILVPALVDQLKNHPVSLEVFAKHTSGQHDGVTSAHALAECYSVLTSLPVPRRITPSEARRLIDESIRERLEVMELREVDYGTAIEELSRRGLAGGIICDALHAVAAQKAQCSRLYTYNVDHFRAVCPDSIVVSAP
jgi:predicted nucleic acid-binding protein